MRQNFLAQFIQLLKRWLGAAMENWALSIDQCQLQALHFSVHHTNLLSILLRCNGFAGIQKAVVDETGSRPPNSDHDLFFGASLALGSALGLLLGPTTELVVTGCHIKSTFLHTSHPIKKYFIVV
ncbi:hypothetical protein M91_01231 [Bos mutus]|uniref:Uncharacterized protein n=1 Tax=Bos mutus TaxID=72004 RepID=L8IU40_9CETA|nr:hypothetical protein M91_01231 [Bos mutus]